MALEHDSFVNGAFRGWRGRGTYELADGSVWKQVNYRYQYQYLYRPRARVISQGGRLLLEIEGMDDAIEVRRVPRERAGQE
jgi:hypothetical protein